MNHQPTPGGDEGPAGATPIEQAAGWFGRREVGLSPAEEETFARWLQADERHARAYREIDHTWTLLDGMQEAAQRKPATRPEAAERGRVVPHRRRRILLFPIALAAAAAVALVAFWRAPPTGNTLVQRARTEADGMHKMELADGSVVHLNANSAVEVRFTATERRVQLVRGEAHFAVAKNPARPFTVSAGSVAVAAIGTAFNVRLSAEGVAVFVTEGTVSVAPAKGSTALRGSQPDRQVGASILSAGQRVTIPVAEAATATPVIEPMAREEMEHALAWQTRMLEFDRTPLGEVVAQFNRYNQHQLAIADAELAQRRFGGTFRADNLEAFVSLLEARFGVVATRSGDRTVLRQ